jgi:hypothetical protein
VTQPAASLPWRSTIEDEIGTIGTSEMLSAIEMHMTELKTGGKSESALSKNEAMKGTMTTMVLTTISLTDTIP